MASATVITAVLTFTFSGLANTQIIPTYQLAFINQSASFILNSNYSGVWNIVTSGAYVPLPNCSCTEAKSVDDSNLHQLYFNSTKISDADRYAFVTSTIGVFDAVPSATLSLLDVVVETNVSDGGLAVWDNVLVTCTLLFFNGHVSEQAAFAAPINITINGSATYQYTFLSNTSSGNATYDLVLPASNQYHCTASFSDNNVIQDNNAKLKTKTVATTTRYQLWYPLNKIRVNVSDQMMVNVWDVIHCSADANPSANVTWEKQINGNQWSAIQYGAVLNLTTVQNATFRCTAFNVIRGIVYNITSDIFVHGILDATSGKVTVIVETSPATPAPFTPFSAPMNIVSSLETAIGVGVGVGVGLTFVILVVVVVACIVCACRRKDSKTRDEKRPENKDDVTEPYNDNGYTKGNAKLPEIRTSMHNDLTIVDNNLYSGAYVDEQQSSPTAVVALRSKPEDSDNFQVYDEIRASMIDSIMTKTNGHVSKALSPPPALPHDSNHLTVPESGVSFGDSQTDLTLVDSAIYSSNGTGLASSGMQLHAAGSDSISSPYADSEAPIYASLSDS